MSDAKSRVPALTKERRTNLLRFLKGGLPIDTAARLVGVHESTVRTWRSRSRAKRPGFAGFEAEVVQALAEGEAILVARVTTAGRDNWRAAAWLLERMYPDRYGPPPPPMSIPDAPPVAVEDDLAGL
jgi:transposase